jgi:hypothetical protein
MAPPLAGKRHDRSGSPQLGSTSTGLGRHSLGHGKVTSRDVVYDHHHINLVVVF